MQVLRTNINKRYSKSLKIPCRLCSQGSDTRWWQLSNYTTWEVFYPASNAEDGVPRILSFLSQEEFLTSILGYFLKNVVFPCYFVLNLTNKKIKKIKKSWRAQNTSIFPSLEACTSTADILGIYLMVLVIEDKVHNLLNS